MLHLHNVVRWAVILTGLWALLRALPLLGGRRSTVPADRKAGLFFLISCDIQLLLGLYLYITRGWGSQLANGGAAIMKNKGLRFWTVEHGPVMILAIIFVHLGYSAIKRGAGRNWAIWTLLAMIIILATTPWPFREVVGRGLFPGMGA